MGDEIELQEDIEIENDSQDEVDYKAKYEEEKYRVEKISKDFKSMQSDFQRTESRLEKQMKVLVESGIAEVDPNFNLVIKKKEQDIQQQKDDESEISRELKQVRKQFNNGDIDQDTLFDRQDELTAKLAEIKATKTAEAIISRQQLAEQEKILSQQKIASNTETQQKLWMVAEKYPDSNDKDSDLFKKMDELYNSNKGDYLDRGLDPMTSPIIREKLIKDAYEELGEKPKVATRFSSMKPSPYTQESAADKVIIEYNFDPKLKKDNQFMTRIKNNIAVANSNSRDKVWEL